MLVERCSGEMPIPRFEWRDVRREMPTERFSWRDAHRRSSSFNGQIGFVSFEFVSVIRQARRPLASSPVASYFLFAYLASLKKFGKLAKKAPNPSIMKNREPICQEHDLPDLSSFVKRQLLWVQIQRFETLESKVVLVTSVTVVCITKFRLTRLKFAAGWKEFLFSGGRQEFLPKLPIAGHSFKRPMCEFRGMCSLNTFL